MGTHRIRKVAAKHPIILSVLAILVPLVFAGVLLVNAATNQLNEQYRQRLIGGLSTYGVFLNDTLNELDRSIHKLSSDSVLQVSINSHVNAALERFLEVQAQRYELDFLNVVDHQGRVVAAYSKNPDNLSGVVDCQDHTRFLLSHGSHLYLASARRIKRYRRVLGTLCGGSAINQTELVDSLHAILRGIPFLSLDHQAFPLVDNGFSYDAAILAPIGQMFEFNGQGEKVYGMMGELRVGHQRLGMGLLVPGSTYRESYSKAAIAVLISLLVMVLIGLIAIRSQMGKRHAQAALKDANQQALVTLSSIGDTVITINSAGHIEFMNLAGERLTGVSNKDAFGHHWQDVIEVVDETTSQRIDLVSNELRGEVSGPEYPHLILKGKHKNTPVKYTAAAICERGARSGVVLVIHDVSKEHALHRRLDWKANHDELTRLPNRASFYRQLESLLAEVSQGNITHALLFLDLDRFKVVNDSCGHAAGDTLLKEVCQRFSQNLRDSDTLARLGGDEFGVLLRGITINDALKVGNKLVECLRDYRFQHQCQSFSVGVSIGLVGLDQNRLQREAILKAADAACYAAKAQGRNQVQCASQSRMTQGMQDKTDWMSVIRFALEHNRFLLGRKSMVASPVAVEGMVSRLDKLQIDLVTAEGVQVAASAFLPVAKRYGLMAEIDRHVITRLLSEASCLDSEMTTRTSHFLMVPVSDDSLTDDAFPGFLKALLSTCGKDVSLLYFSIPEAMLVTNFERVKKIADVVSSAGSHIMVSGVQLNLAIFEYLDLLAVSLIEVDHFLVQKAALSKADRLALQSLIQLSRVLGIRTMVGTELDECGQSMILDIGFDFMPSIEPSISMIEC